MNYLDLALNTLSLGAGFAALTVGVVALVHPIARPNIPPRFWMGIGLCMLAGFNFAWVIERVVS